MYKSVIINLIGSPNVGKTTLASEIFKELKIRGESVEWCMEHVKWWTYQNKAVRPFDQMSIMAKEMRHQFGLIGKVKYIISDSPIYLSPFYQKHYQPFGGDNMLKVAQDHINWAENKGVSFLNFLLYRNKPYIQQGRYQTEEEAKEVEIKLKDWLEENRIDFYHLSQTDDLERLNCILNKIKMTHKEDLHDNLL